MNVNTLHMLEKKIQKNFDLAVNERQIDNFGQFGMK